MERKVPTIEGCSTQRVISCRRQGKQLKGDSNNGEALCSPRSQNDIERTSNQFDTLDKMGDS